MTLVTPFRVGLLVLISAAFLFVFFAFIWKGGLSRSESFEVFAYFNNASGISERSRVQVAGIPVGEVKSVALEGNRARVTLRIQKELNLRQNAALTKRSESFLGDYLLDLFPGTDDAERMPDGGQITRVIDQQEMDVVVSSLERITGDIQSVTHSLHEVLGGDQGQNALEQLVQNLVATTENTDRLIAHGSVQLDSIFRHVEGATGTVSAIAHEQKDAIGQVISNTAAITRDVREVVSTVKKSVAGNDGDLQDSAGILKDGLARLHHSLANVEEVAERVKKGEGALGQLMADKRLTEKISEAVEDVSGFLGRLFTMKLEAGIRTEYLFAQGAFKPYLYFMLTPDPTKHFLVELLDDPRGNTHTVTIQSNPPTAGQPAVQQVTTTTSRLKFSVELAKRYPFTTLRFGIIESTAGLGADLHLFRDMLTLKLDAFDFSATAVAYPRLRATLRLKFERVFATAGIDDILNSRERNILTGQLVSGRDFFVGVGVFTE